VDTKDIDAPPDTDDLLEEELKESPSGIIYRGESLLDKTRETGRRIKERVEQVTEYCESTCQ
jgi:hypothetical protein